MGDILDTSHERPHPFLIKSQLSNTERVITVVYTHGLLKVGQQLTSEAVELARFLEPITSNTFVDMENGSQGTKRLLHTRSQAD